MMQLADKARFPYPIERLWLPHDARAKSLGTGMSIEEILRKKGYKVSIVPRLDLEDGIQAVRASFPQMWFDEKRCSIGLEALRNYRYEYRERDREAGGFKNEPVHDEYSHGSDALRYLAIALRAPKIRNPLLSAVNNGWAKFDAPRSQTSWMNI
jgi:phage terminase large subunit